eukprot:6581154-Pyramimonas_sp.AAC.1
MPRGSHKRPPTRVLRGPPKSPKRLHNCPSESPQSAPKRPQEAGLRTLTRNPGTVAGWAKGHYPPPP